MKYYCIGIKGTGMSTLAQILFDLGNEVSGYDDATGYKFTQDGLEKRNINIYYDQNHELDPETIVTYSVACPIDHKELVRARELGLTIKKYNEIVGDITNMFETIGVSGTHGKTTTTSIIRHILEKTVGCNYFVGSGDGKVTKENKYFVIESDEFNRHFLAYHPTYSIITNIEKEHMECYSDIDDIRNTFESFVNKTKNFAVVCGDNDEIRKINYTSKVYFYGFNDNNDIVIKNLELNSNGSSFDLYLDNELYGSFTIPLYGKHMILDATAAIIVCKNLGIEEKQIEDALSSFRNAKRRFAIEEVNGTTIVDDYAHHPTEIKVTLEAVKQKYPDKDLTVIFKPNTYSRTKDFTNEFVEALNIADNVFLTEIESNREKQEDYPGVSSHMITDKLDNGQIIDENNLEIIKNYSDNVICVMSCADVSHLIENLKEVL
ncbi:MAG: UDP-N-acetylmuramate--L-alanine ligase [Bacilli bacterium]|nr:UDP-N-acetylmuramate--L-alanine ligase [Bacilli bacterium]